MLLSRRSLFALPFASAFAGRWDAANFPDWDQKLIDRIVSDSPWAKTWTGTVVQPVDNKRLISSRWSQPGLDLPPLPRVGGSRFPGSGGSAPRIENTGPVMLRISADLIMRWASALPVRRALALQQFGRAGLGQPQAKALLSQQPDDFVLELAGIPHLLVSPELERNLRQARLLLPDRRPMTPLSVEVPTMGTHVTARLNFARFGKLSPDAGSARLLLDSGPLKIEQEFKLKSMIYEGRVEM